jgi:LysM repeat protein
MSEDDLSLVSDRSGTPNMRIGIDTTGGVNPYGADVVWSDPVQAYDLYLRFSIQAQAKGNLVTVFTFSEPSVNPNSPDYGFKHTDMYWDDAALVVVGEGTAAPAAAFVTGAAASNPAPAPARVYIPGPTPTPDAEGNIIVEVQSGDSYWAIAARAGITLDRLFEINGLSRADTPNPGEKVIIGHGDPPGASPETVSSEETATEGETTEPIATPTPMPAPTQVVISVAEEEISGVSICLKAFDDANQNSLHDPNELLRQNVAFTISNSQQVVSNYVTDGAMEPFCIEGLEAGGYHVTRSVLVNEVVTTADKGNWAIALTEGSSLNLESGSYLTSESLSGEESVAVEGEDGGLDVLTIAAIVIIVILLGAILFVLISARRRAD